MGLAIPNTTATDQFVQWGGGSIYRAGGYLFVGNGPVDLIQEYGTNTGITASDGPFTLGPGPYTLNAEGANKQSLISIKVRASAGLFSNPVQQYYGGLFDNVGLIPGSPFTGTLNPSGGLTPGPGAMTQIAQQVVTAPTGTIVFSPIPLTFTNLRLEWSALTNNAAEQRLYCFFNNNLTLADYVVILTENLDGTLTGGAIGSQAQIGVCGTSGGAYVGWVDIPSYTIGDIVRAVGQYGGAAVHSRQGTFTLLGNSSTITSLTLTPAAGQFISGTIFTLYGF